MTLTYKSGTIVGFIDNERNYRVGEIETGGYADEVETYRIISGDKPYSVKITKIKNEKRRRSKKSRGKNRKSDTQRKPRINGSYSRA